MDLRKILVTELDDVTLLPASRHSDLRHRRLARYNDEFVLLDPKDYGENPDDSSGDKVYDRVKALAQQLSSFPWPFAGDDGIRTLLCKGWYEDQSTSQFYFVFRLPPECEEPCQPKSLYQIYRTSKPSVGTRIRLARSLAITVRKIHESGWLHKGIRSDHVLFFPRRPGGRPDLDNPRLVGFDFARRDGPYEYSDKPIEKHANLYRHPKALRDPTVAFRKLHDYYSFGVVMVEIACWRPMDDILRKFQDLNGEECKEEDARKVKDILLDKDTPDNYPREVAFKMGGIYCRAVEKCLRGNFGAEDGRELLDAFQTHVIDELGRCVI